VVSKEALEGDMAVDMGVDIKNVVVMVEEDIVVVAAMVVDMEVDSEVDMVESLRNGAKVFLKKESRP